MIPLVPYTVAGTVFKHRFFNKKKYIYTCESSIFAILGVFDQFWASISPKMEFRPQIFLETNKYRLDLWVKCKQWQNCYGTKTPTNVKKAHFTHVWWSLVKQKVNMRLIGSFTKFEYSPRRKGHDNGLRLLFVISELLISVTSYSLQVTR